MAMKKKREIMSKNDKGSTLKISDPKTPKKPKKKDVVINRPSLPEGLKYKIKQILSHPLRVGAVCTHDFANHIKASLGEEWTKLFKETIFDPYLEIPQCKLKFHK